MYTYNKQINKTQENQTSIQLLKNIENVLLLGIFTFIFTKSNSIFKDIDNYFFEIWNKVIIHYLKYFL